MFVLRRHFIVLAGLLAPVIASGASATTLGGKLIAHRAVYDLSLARADDSNSAPVGASGRIVYEFTGSACEGWSTNFRQVTQLQMSEGGDRVSDLRSASFEDADGASFQFKTDTLVNGRLIESVDGSAKRSDDGGVSINLSKPSPSKVDFAAAAVFPTAQILAIMEAAKAGHKTAAIKIFDGSDTGQKLFDTMTIIGKEREDAAKNPVAAEAESLRDTPRWPVSVSYFDPEKRDGPPNYILGFDLYENGVSAALHIDYGSYALTGKLTKFEKLPQKSCDK